MQELKQSKRFQHMFSCNSTWWLQTAKAHFRFLSLKINLWFKKNASSFCQRCFDLKQPWCILCSPSHLNPNIWFSFIIIHTGQPGTGGECAAKSDKYCNSRKEISPGKHHPSNKHHQNMCPKWNHIWRPTKYLGCIFFCVHVGMWYKMVDEQKHGRIVHTCTIIANTNRNK